MYDTSKKISQVQNITFTLYLFYQFVEQLFSKISTTVNFTYICLTSNQINNININICIYNKYKYKYNKSKITINN